MCGPCPHSNKEKGACGNSFTCAIPMTYMFQEVGILPPRPSSSLTPVPLSKLNPVGRFLGSVTVATFLLCFFHFHIGESQCGICRPLDSVCSTQSFPAPSKLLSLQDSLFFIWVVFCCAYKPWFLFLFYLGGGDTPAVFRNSLPTVLSPRPPLSHRLLLGQAPAAVPIYPPVLFDVVWPSLHPLLQAT